MNRSPCNLDQPVWKRVCRMAFGAALAGGVAGFAQARGDDVRATINKTCSKPNKVQIQFAGGIQEVPNGNGQVVEGPVAAPKVNWWCGDDTAPQQISCPTETNYLSVTGRISDSPTADSLTITCLTRYPPDQ